MFRNYLSAGALCGVLAGAFVMLFQGNSSEATVLFTAVAAYTLGNHTGYRTGEKDTILHLSQGSNET